MRRQARSHLRSLAHAITVAEARERERIARGLHDDIGQFLVCMRLKLGELRQCPAPGAQSVLLADIGALLTAASRATRSATFDLSCPVLGLEPALRSLADRLVRDGGLQVSFNCAPALPALTDAILAVLFRSVQELCLNVQKHAVAGRVHIAVHGDGRQLRIGVTDDGVGCRARPSGQRLSRDGGFGLASMHLQLQAIGGRLDIRPGTARGTCATIALPLLA